MATAAITGHRPNRIPDMDVVALALHDAFIDLGITHVIQGMADGVDLISASVAWDYEIPFSSARPWHEHKPSEEWSDSYTFALTHSENLWIVNDAIGYPGPQVYQERNEFMVDRADILIAVWDDLKMGGTWNTIKYAIKTGCPIWRIDPLDGSADYYEAV